MKIPAEKIDSDLPFCGRNPRARDATTYRGIRQRFSPKPDQDVRQGVYFSGPETIRRKTEYAIRSRPAGVMIGELGQELQVMRRC
jgi:hypothetical protein